MGSFRGAQFLQIGNIYHFTDLNFTDVLTHAHYALYNISTQCCVDLITVVNRLTMKTKIIWPLKYFLLYGGREAVLHIMVFCAKD